MKTDNYNSPWRKLSTAIYAPPRDGRIYGTLDVDITRAQQFVSDSRKNGKKITLTHVASAALGRIFGYHIPEINCFVKRGTFVPRDDVIVTVAVNMKGGQEMSNIRIHDAHNKTVFDIGNEVRDKAARARQGTENAAVKNKYTLSKIPWPFHRWAFLLIRFIHHGLGIELPSMGLAHNAFGSVLLSNIGSHGLTTGMAALFPAGNIPAVIIMGKTEEKPVVRDGEIVVRTIMPFTATMDHRILDGFHGGLLAHYVKKYMENPELLETLYSEETIG